MAPAACAAKFTGIAPVGHETCVHVSGLSSLHDVNNKSIQAFAQNGKTYSLFMERAGGARRDRTDDIVLAKHALSQLSYGPS